MSYDVALQIDTGSGKVDLLDWNYTSNCAPMWREAGCDIAAFDDRPAVEFSKALCVAITAMTADPDKYRAMNPPNGWGDYDSCLKWLADMQDACDRHHRCTVRVSR
jgi:hypothetical protein